MPSEDSSTELFAPGAEAYYRRVLKLDEPPVSVDEYGHRSDCEGCAGPNCGPPDPPLTPEEEEEAGFCVHPEGYEGECPCPPSCDCCKAEPPADRGVCVCGFDPYTEKEHRPDCPVFAVPPPQPERRPPYAVAYSANGHLYEVMLPGDAIVTAVDGALIIKHADFQINGIVQVLPVRTREAS